MIQKEMCDLPAVLQKAINIQNTKYSEILIFYVFGLKEKIHNVPLSRAWLIQLTRKRRLCQTKSDL